MVTFPKGTVRAVVVFVQELPLVPCARTWGQGIISVPKGPQESQVE